MSSWVRYCVAVYVGLLISGALARPPWTYPDTSGPMPQPAQRGAEPGALPVPGLELPDAHENKSAAAPADSCATLIG